jgi:subtilisin family serine protease
MSRPSFHGTAVASLFVGWSRDFAGAAPGADLRAIDVYCAGGAPGGRLRDVVTALGELAAARCRVINLSIVGPDNAVLEAAVRAVQAQAILVVAATGNDGPNARPLYPAAYPGVIAVSAVDARWRVLPEASGGAHVTFAAPGADILAASPGGGLQPVRGTSFAAPLVAGMLARELANPGVDGDLVVQRLVAMAQDRGRKGRDSRYGFGLVGADLAVASLMAHPPDP